MDNTTLKEIAKRLDFIVSSINRIESGFDESDTEAMALLLFFRERRALDMLANIRKVLHLSLEELMGKSEYDEWLEQELELWKPPYEKTKEELLSMLEALKTRRR